MQVRFLRRQLRRRFPFVISRGRQPDPENLFVVIERDGVSGIGEMPVGPGHAADSGEADIRRVLAAVPAAAAITTIDQTARELGISPRAHMALDVALWDALGKQAGLPLFRLFGLPARQVATSITVGIGKPEELGERVREILEISQANQLKIKLGSPEGLDHDRASFAVIKEAAAPFGVGLRVDANGGWDVADARVMMRELAAAGVAYIEQPLHQDADEDLPAIFADRPLPLFVDESCRVAADVVRLAPHVDGVNAKLAKAGGLTETLRIAATARAHGLSTMIGCFGESSLAISAGAAIGALFDHIDLDSHLLLLEDPARGALLVDGSLVPPERPGHGSELRDA